MSLVRNVSALRHDRRDLIESEIGKAEEYLKAAGILHHNGFYEDASHAAFCSAYHCCVAAFMTKGTARRSPNKEAYSDFAKVLERFNLRLSPFVGALRGIDPGGANPQGGAKEDGESALEIDASFKLHQAREFVSEVRFFLKRVMKTIH